ncbi:hypothetical protein KGP26_29720 (plasmid) [Serratia sp. JSRIV002]|uniref:hypothetical protein n=1 Tax=Serratia sp. JSRIV002 TaxID=2831894 RepID=UPI001CC07B9E|nr:hypothetical protein [Serratia sp. JSRIV002]UAN54730.1 hypothetical protein KGP26_29720 [Serratia sp. JSRIV002]
MSKDNDPIGIEELREFIKEGKKFCEAGLPLQMHVRIASELLARLEKQPVYWLWEHRSNESFVTSISPERYPSASKLLSEGWMVRGLEFSTAIELRRNDEPLH